jgi:two-component system, sensor histidine kinase and response regulator
VIPPALDAAVLESLRQLNQAGQPDIVHEVLTVFLADAPVRVAAIDEAIRSGEGQSLQRAAHALKGAAGSIGATSLQASCRELEEIGKAGTLDGAPDLGRRIHEEFARVRTEIAEILATG